jgi:hypothetical protein
MPPAPDIIVPPPLPEGGRVRVVRVAGPAVPAQLERGVTRLRDGFTGAREPVGLGPTLDRALAALMDDLQERGLWDETLLVVMGEFGRTPKWNAGGGRDHWPRVFSVMLAGGPIEGGRVVGASDRYGESPEEDPVTPGDLCHTILASMGIDPATVVQTPDGRPIRLAPEGSRRV